MGDYRFNPTKGFRRRGMWYGQMEDTELDSEDYDSIEDWFEAIKEHFTETILVPDEEQEDDSE